MSDLSDDVDNIPVPKIGTTADDEDPIGSTISSLSETSELNDTEGLVASLEQLIASAPTTVHQPFDILNYASKDDNGDSTMLSTRTPMSWAAIINEIIQDPATPFSSVFRTRSDFVRWAIWRGLSAAQAFRVTLRDHRPDDPIAAAHIFSERTMGMINARTTLINKIQNDVNQLANALQVISGLGERSESANIINYYMNGVAEQQDAFWRAMFTKSLFQNDSLRTIIVSLIEEGLVLDHALIDYAATNGWIDASYLIQSGDDPELPPLDLSEN